MEHIVRAGLALSLVCGLLSAFASPARSDSLVMGLENEIRLFDLQSNAMTAIKETSLTDVSAVAYDSIDNMVYYASGSLFTSINRMRPGGSGKDVFQRNDVGIVYGMEVDTQGRRLYWTDSTNNRIESSSLDGSDRTVIIDTDLSGPRNIRLDPRSNMMYWTECGAFKIQRAITDGSSRQTLVDASLSCPWGLTLDLNSDLLYWTDYGRDVLERSKLDGSERELVHSELTNPRGLALQGDNLFWTTDDTLQRSSASPRSDKELLASVLLSVEDFKVVRLTNGKEIIIACGGPRIMTYDLAMPDDLGFAIPLANLSDVVAVDYNQGDNMLYWVDKGRRAISRARLDGSDQQVIVDSGITSLGGLGLSPATATIFWTDLGNEVIERCNSDGSDRRVIVRQRGFGLFQPGRIIVDDRDSMIYWTDSTKIERASVNGNNRQSVVGVGSTDDLTIDRDRGLLYWTSGFSTVEVSNLNGSQRQTVIEDQQFGLFVDQIFVHDHFLYASTSSGEIMKVNTVNYQDPSLAADVVSKGFTSLALMSKADRSNSNVANMTDTCIGSTCESDASRTNVNCVFAVAMLMTAAVWAV